MRVFLLKIVYPLLALTSFVNPFYGVLNYAFITIIRPESLTWGGAVVKNVSFFAITCLFLGSLLKKTFSFSFLRKPFFIWFALFYLFLLYSTVQSPTTYLYAGHKEFTLGFVRQILIIFVYCICLYGAIEYDLKKVNTFLNMLMLMFLFMAIWGIEQRLHGNRLVEGLFGSAIKDRCAITGVFILVFPIALFNYHYPPGDIRFWKYCGLFSSVVFAVMVFFTDSRAGFLGFIFCIGILCISMKNKIRNLLLLCISFAIIFPLLPDNYQKRIYSIGKASEGTGAIDHSAGSRIVMWKSAVIVFLNNPLLGVGNLNFAEEAYNNRHYFEGKISPGLFNYTFQENFKLQCHNMYLNIFAEGGLATSIPFYLLMVIPIIKAIRLRKIGGDKSNYELHKVNRLLFYLFSGLMGYMVTCFFANMRFIDYFYWMLTLIYVVSGILEHEFRKHADDPDTQTTS